MSYILDALKKSEQERQRGQAPNLGSIHDVPPPAPARNRAPLLLLALLVAVGLGTGGWWAGQSLRPATAVPHPGAAAPGGEAAQVAPAPIAETPPPQAAQEESSSSLPVPAEVALDTSRSPPRALWELPDDVQRRLPAMTFSFHVHASDPARRTIIINNRRLREGERVAEEVVLEEITEDGVILLHDRHRIHIPVLEGW